MRGQWMICYLALGGLGIGGCTEGNLPTAVDGPALAQSGGLTSVVCDAIGDAAFKLNTGPGSAEKVPVWQDITRAEISKNEGIFSLTMDLAGPLPAAPPNAPGGLGWYEWGWAFETDATTFPAGDPFPDSRGAPSSTAPFEFFVVLIWDGSAFQGIVVDRRPLLSNRDVIVTPVALALDGAHVQLSVPSTLLGEPSTFEWAAFTEIRHAHWGTNAFENPDAAPDVNLGAALAPWPGPSVCR